MMDGLEISNCKNVKNSSGSKLQWKISYHMQISQINISKMRNTFIFLSFNYDVDIVLMSLLNFSLQDRDFFLRLSISTTLVQTTLASSHRLP
jgi:hypothetical protein